MINTVIDGVRDTLSRLLLFNLDTIGDEICDLVEDDGIVAQINSNDQEGRSWRIATLLSGQTKNKYEHLRKSLIKEFKMDNKEIPSYYHFTKRRPKCKEHILVPSNILEWSLGTLNILSELYRHAIGNIADFLPRLLLTVAGSATVGM